MSKFHINPETGRPNVCRATVKNCPVGGAHYTSKEDARQGYENEMKAKTFLKPFNIKKVKITPERLKNASYDIDYDYDYVYCADSDCGMDGDYCRDSTYSGLRMTDWGSSAGVYGYARSKMNIPHDMELPQALEDKLKPYEDFSSIEDDFELYTEYGYYGEEIRIEGSPILNKIITDFLDKA